MAGLAQSPLLIAYCLLLELYGHARDRRPGRILCSRSALDLRPLPLLARGLAGVNGDGGAKFHISVV